MKGEPVEFMLLHATIGVTGLLSVTDSQQFSSARERKTTQPPSHGSPTAPSKTRLKNLAHSMSWIGLALMGVFAVLTLSDAWPPALLQPEWQQRVGQRIVGNAGITALIGSFLVVAAPAADPGNEPLKRRERLLRHLAYAAAIGFALLIPLQMVAGVRILKAADREQAATVKQARAAAQAIQESTTLAELRQAYERLPGTKPQFPNQLDEPLGLIRDRITDRISPNIKRLESDFEETLSERWQYFWFKYVLENSILCVMFFLGFASLGKGPGSKKTLLEAFTTQDSTATKDDKGTRSKNLFQKLFSKKNRQKPRSAKRRVRRNGESRSSGS